VHARTVAESGGGCMVEEGRTWTMRAREKEGGNTRRRIRARTQARTRVAAATRGRGYESTIT
jgi:hypothetical protein